MDEQTMKLIRSLISDQVRYASSAARAAELERQLEQLRTDHDNVGLANVGLSRAYQRNLEELEALKAEVKAADPGGVEQLRIDRQAMAEEIGELRKELEKAKFGRDLAKAKYEAHEGVLDGFREQIESLKEERDALQKEAEAAVGQATGQSWKKLYDGQIGELDSVRSDLNVSQALLRSLAGRLEKREQRILRSFSEHPMTRPEGEEWTNVARELGEIYRQIDQHLPETE